MFFAFLFESVGGGEWLVLLAVILIVVGPKNLPAAARKMGQVMSQLRRAADEFKRQLMSMDEEMRRAAEEVQKEYVKIPDLSEPDAAAAPSAEPTPESEPAPHPERVDGSAPEAGEATEYPRRPPEYGGDPDWIRREDGAPADGAPGDVVAAEKADHGQISAAD